jgi:hypothetical protein
MASRALLAVADLGGGFGPPRMVGAAGAAGLWVHMGPGGILATNGGVGGNESIGWWLCAMVLGGDVELVGVGGLDVLGCRWLGCLEVGSSTSCCET